MLTHGGSVKRRIRLHARAWRFGGLESAAPRHEYLPAFASASSSSSTTWTTRSLPRPHFFTPASSWSMQPGLAVAMTWARVEFTFTIFFSRMDMERSVWRTL